MNIKEVNDCIKELRLFSISAFIFAAYLLLRVVEWVTDKSDPAAMGDGLLVTGLVTALVGLCKFIFEFAIKKPSNGRDE